MDLRQHNENYDRYNKIVLTFALLPNATRLFGEMSKKRQRRAVVNLENNFSISAFT
jgi:mannose/fructose/N-acetylgalactosamine-specific phosphotransferase system component IID